MTGEGMATVGRGREMTGEGMTSVGMTGVEGGT